MLDGTCVCVCVCLPEPYRAPYFQIRRETATDIMPAARTDEKKDHVFCGTVVHSTATRSLAICENAALGVQQGKVINLFYFFSPKKSNTEMTDDNKIKGNVCRKFAHCFV